MKKITFYLTLIIFLLCSNFSFAEEKELNEERRIKTELPSVSIKGVKTKSIKIIVEVKKAGKWEIDRSYNDKVEILGIKNLDSKDISNSFFTKPLVEGKISLSNIEIISDSVIVKSSSGISNTSDIFFINGFFSLMPPIIAIVLAFLTHSVTISIFSGIIFGLFFVYHYNILSAIIHFFDKFMLDAITDKSHASIIIFCLTLGGIIKLIGSSGGVEGIVNIVTKYASTRKSGLFSTWFMGLLIFFDDYASALLVGNTMRPYTDSLKISREKLSYLVDTMAAPVSCMAVISTWIGFQLGQIEIAMAGTSVKEFSAYNIFLASLPYNFYCIFSIIFPLILIFLERDFGSMVVAEKRALIEGKVYSEKSKNLIEDNNTNNIKPQALNAIVPILSIILITAYGILYTGTESLGLTFSEITFSNLKSVMAASSTSKVLLWSGILGLLFSITSITLTKTMKITEAVDVFIKGASSMFFAIVILCQAWVLASVCSELGTNYYLINLIGDGISLSFLPLIVFLVASIISFATGTSYGTMGILFPLVAPLTASLLASNGLEVVSSGNYNNIFLGVIGAVFSGALFGDHCSPISDTTTMSSLSTGCDMLEHFSTQLVYGIFVLIVSALTGFITIGFGINPFIYILFGIISMIIFTYFFGKKHLHKSIINTEKI